MIDERKKLLISLADVGNEKVKYLTENTYPSLEFGKTTYDLLQTLWNDLGLDAIATQFKPR